MVYIMNFDICFLQLVICAASLFEQIQPETTPTTTTNTTTTTTTTPSATANTTTTLPNTSPTTTQIPTASSTTTLPNTSSTTTLPTSSSNTTTTTVKVTDIPAAESIRRPVICYYTLRGLNRKISFRPKHIPTGLCTDVIMDFAEIQMETHLDTIDGHQNDKIIQDVRKKTTGMKLHVSFGKWRKTAPFQALTSSETKMREFASSAVEYLDKHSFDGLVISWEYPGYWYKQHFSSLIRILYEKFNSVAEKTNKRYLLSATVNSWYDYVKIFYEPHILSDFLDYILVKSYDYYGIWTWQIGPMSALYAKNHYSQDASMKAWIAAGVERNKIVMGISTYARTFKLRSQLKFNFGENFLSSGSKGNFTQYRGILAYSEVCQLFGTFKREWSDKHQVPLLHGKRCDNWETISYEDVDSMKKKAEYVVEQGLAGVYFYAFDYDDFRNLCNASSFPLIRAVSEHFDKEYKESESTGDELNWVHDENTGKKYRMFPTTTFDKTSNAKKCRKFGGILPEPRFYGENNFLNDMSTEMFFLGMTQSRVSGVWTWDSDKSIVLWSNWDPDAENKSRESCAFMYRNQDSKGPLWGDVKCQSDTWWDGKFKSLICQKDESNWITDENSGKQYVVLPIDDLNHDLNQEICHNMGGFLPEPKNKAENDFLNSLGANVFQLGMTDYLTEGIWFWDSDRTPVKWTSWIEWQEHTAEPDGGERESCAFVARNIGEDSGDKGYRPEGWCDGPCHLGPWWRISYPKSLICQKNKANKCVGKKQTYWADKKDCSKFYHCNEKEETILMFCPIKFLFNPKTSFCDKEANVNCYRDKIKLATGDSGTVLKTTFTVTLLTAMLTKVIAM